jgi:hypothetical protein
MLAPCNACQVEFPDSSGTPLACPGATTREHDPVWGKTTTSVPLNPILADQVWAREIQQGRPISLGLAPWNEIRPKKYPSPGITVVPLWQNSCNLSCAISLGSAPWNLYPARNVDTNVHIEKEFFNLLKPDGTIPLGRFAPAFLL